MTPQPPEDDSDRPDATTDEIWAQIVANFGERAVLDDGPRRRPAPLEAFGPRMTGTGTEQSSDHADHREGTADETTSDAVRMPWGPRPEGDVVLPEVAEHSDPDAADLAQESAQARLARDDRFVPPTPPPLPRPTGLRGAAWVGVLGVPLLVLISLFASIYLPNMVVGLLLGWFLAGFGYLVATMEKTPRDPFDDGSRV